MCFLDILECVKTLRLRAVDIFYLVGGFYLFMVMWDGYTSRTIDGLARYAKSIVRDENPIFFWFHVGVYVAICFLCLYLVIKNK